MKNAQLLTARRQEQLARLSIDHFYRTVRIYAPHVLDVLPLNPEDLGHGVPLSWITEESSTTIAVTRECLCWLHHTDQARTTTRGSGLWRRFVLGVDMPAGETHNADGSPRKGRRAQGAPR